MTLLDTVNLGITKSGIAKSERYASDAKSVLPRD